MFHDLKGDTCTERENEFLSANKLLYTACCEEVVVKQRIIGGHIGSSKHAKGKAKLYSKEIWEKDITSLCQGAHVISTCWHATQQN